MVECGSVELDPGSLTVASFLFVFAFQAVVKGAAGPAGGAGEAGCGEPEAFSGEGAADVQAAAQRLMLDHPPARHGAGDHAQMTAVTGARTRSRVLRVHSNLHCTAAHNYTR